ncbi:MAG: hypothetical protein ACK4FB_05600 [Brevundimonas sp.]|uniref:hypothetical protein n=1 Tax=Brevundimonas sp. TaxID=1871086 RepID=UPI00391A3A33
MSASENTPGPRPYLVHVAPDGDITFPATAVCRLADGLYIVVSALTRSRLYHRIKREASPGAALLVAPLAEAPKFKGMSRGALAFTREIWPPA